VPALRGVPSLRIVHTYRVLRCSRLVIKNATFCLLARRSKPSVAAAARLGLAKYSSVNGSDAELRPIDLVIRFPAEV
jgi:hypothetical protein